MKYTCVCKLFLHWAGNFLKNDKGEQPREEKGRQFKSRWDKDMMEVLKRISFVSLVQKLIVFMRELNIMTILFSLSLALALYRNFFQFE